MVRIGPVTISDFSGTPLLGGPREIPGPNRRTELPRVPRQMTAYLEHLRLQSSVPYRTDSIGRPKGMALQKLPYFWDIAHLRSRNRETRLTLRPAQVMPSLFGDTRSPIFCIQKFTCGAGPCCQACAQARAPVSRDKPGNDANLCAFNKRNVKNVRPEWRLSYKYRPAPWEYLKWRSRTLRCRGESTRNEVHLFFYCFLLPAVALQDSF